MVALLHRRLPALILLAAATGSASFATGAVSPRELIEVATNLSILEEEDGSYQVRVSDPVAPSQRNIYRLIPKETPEPSEESRRTRPQDERIPIPAEKIVSLSTTYLGSFVALETADHVAAVDQADYLYAPSLRERHRAGKIIEVGSAGNLDLEALITLKPDLVLLTQINPGQQSLIKRLRAAGIPVLVTAAWRENDPLGRSEWIKLFGILTGEKEGSMRIFSETRERYEELCQVVRETDPAPPLVLLSAPYGGTWYMPGGHSFTAQLLKDAGARSLWMDNDSTGSFPVDLESALLRGFEADYWLNPGRYGSLEELAAADPRFTALPVYQKREIYNRLARIGPTGANDFWESGSVHPDRVLADLIAILHPDLLPDHELVYYRRLR